MSYTQKSLERIKGEKIAKSQLQRNQFMYGPVPDTVVNKRKQPFFFCVKIG